MSGNKWILVAVSLIILTTNLPAVADVVEDAKAIDISGGENHSLALTKNKAAWSCGPNGGSQPSYYGVLGTGSDDCYLIEKTLVRVHGPNDVNYLENINDVDAGWQHSLALDVNGFVWSWGYNNQGQLGVGDNYPRTTPVQVLSGEQDPNDPNSFLQYIETISAGRSGQHSLAVDANNLVWAWGDNYFGQLGDGDVYYDKYTPVRVLSGEQDPNNPNSPLENIIAVSAGEGHSMATDANGFVWTWGDNDYGQLGNGESGSYNEKVTPVQVLSGRQDPNDPNSYLKNIVAVSAGWDHCMALEKYEAYNPLDEFLDPNYTGPDPNYQGRVYTWGRNNPIGYGVLHGGQLGDGTTEDSNTPVTVLSGEQDPCDPNSFLKDIFAISAGESHSLALDVNGFVWAWGDNAFGQLGNDSNDPCTTPVKVVGLNGEGYLENIFAISAGFWHSLAIDANGTIWSWGRGTYGRLGLGDTANSNTPHPIPVVYNITQQTFYFKIQDAIDDANADNVDVIEASPGTYYENIDFLDKSITVRSTDPNYWDVVANTIIDGSNNDSNYVVIFDDNSGSTLAGFTLTNGHYGGIYCYNSHPNITNCLITENGNGNSNGGGIYNDYYSAPNVTNCSFSNNSAREGGAVYNYYYSDPNITNCTFTNNTADNYFGGYGGGMVNSYYASPTITNCIFSGNTATTTSPGSYYSYGGAICNWIDSEPNVTNCTFSNNSSDHQGGAVYNYVSDPNITNCTFSNNLADRGGAVDNNSSDPKVTNCIFSGNSAATYGGGMRNYQSSPTVTNCSFSGNSAGWGGGMQNWQSSPTVTNCTFSGNWAYYGGGMHNEDSSDPNITNCIFWGNDADNDGNEIYNWGDPDPNISYCDIEDSNGSGDNWHRKLGIDGGGNIDSDPLFYDPNDPNDYHLGSNSPCIDAGTNTPTGGLPTTDIDGEDRVTDGDGDGNSIVDMGADEYDYRDADFNNDGTVNFIDYAMFANAWQTENPVFSLDDDNDVDMNDLKLFVKDWLWTAGWAQTRGSMMGQGMSQGFRLIEVLYQPAPAKQPQAQIEPLDIEEVIKWLAEIWLTDEQVRKTISEDEWLRFIKSVGDSY